MTSEEQPLLVPASDVETKKPQSKEPGFCFYVFVFLLTSVVTWGGITVYDHYTKIQSFYGSTDAKGNVGIEDCPFFQDAAKLKPKNDQGIQHAVINAPFDEEIYKYTFWPNYREFKDKYNGSFEVIEKQMSHPINITFYDSDWKEVEAHSIHEMPAEDIADLIRSKGFEEHADKDAYRNAQKAKQPMIEDETREKVRKALKDGTEEEKKQYKDALSALNISEEEFLNPEVHQRNLKLKEEKSKQEDAERKAAHDSKQESEKDL